MTKYQDCSTMKAWVHQAGHSGGRLVETPRPRIKDGWSIVRVEKVGICRTDLQVLDGTRVTQEGRVAGHEFVGRLEYPTEHISQDTPVAVFPVVPCRACPSCVNGGFPWHCTSPKFLGVQFNGAFSQWIQVPTDLIYPIDQALSMEAAAYWEPLSAAWGVREIIKDKSVTVAVVGGGRIAALTVDLLADMGVVADLIEDNKFGNYHIAIECRPDENTLATCVDILAPDGLLLLKSRPHRGAVFPMRKMVEKRIKTQGVHYGNALDALKWMVANQLKLAHLWGQTYPMTQTGIHQALLAEKNEHKKIFIDPWGED